MEKNISKPNKKKAGNIREDEFIASLLERIPLEERSSYSDEQLFRLKIILDLRQWAIHPIDQRGVFGFWTFRFYYVFIAGRDRRSSARGNLAGQTLKTILVFGTVIIFFAILLMLVLNMVSI